LSDHFYPEGNPLVTVIPIMKTGTTRANTTNTKDFEPRGVNRNRLPFKVAFCPRLSTSMEAHLRELLTSGDYRDVADRPASHSLSSEYESLVRYCRGHVDERSLVSESDINDLSARVAEPVLRAYSELTGRTLHFSGQVSTGDRMVRTDRIYHLSDREPLIVWEDKSPRVGERFAPKIAIGAEQGTLGFDRDTQTKWEDEKSILGKVRLAHS